MEPRAWRRDLAVGLLGVALGAALTSLGLRALRDGDRAWPPFPETEVADADSREVILRASQQHYLSGVIYFQKDRHASAREEWTLAVALDSRNADARAGLQRLDRIEGKPR